MSIKKTLLGAAAGIALCLGLSSAAFAQSSANAGWKDGGYTFHTTADKVNDTYTATAEYEAEHGGPGGSSTTNQTTNITGPITENTTNTGPMISSGATNIDQESSTSSTIMGSNITATVRPSTEQTNAGATQSALAQSNGQSSANKIGN